MNWRLVIPMTAVVLVIWLVGAAVTRYSLEQMAYLTPVAVVVVGATIGIMMIPSATPPANPEKVCWGTTISTQAKR